MQATGLLYMTKTRPVMKMSTRGVPMLSITAVHRIASHQVEPWKLTWTGAEAMAFMADHSQDLLPGQALRVTTKNMRSHVVGAMPEIHADVLAIEVLQTEEVAA